MEIQLKRLRKEAGFRSREAFADALGDSYNARQIKSWETGERKLSLEQACVLADFLHCSLDELAGRRFSAPSALHADPAHEELARCYDACTPERRDRMLQDARERAFMSREFHEPAVATDDQAIG